MARPRDYLPRLNGPQLNMPQPGVNFQGQPIFSPVVQNYRPTFPVPNPMQTPMQPFFTPQLPQPPGRPTHHPGRASIAHLASVGIHPPAGFTQMTPVMTPVGGSGHFPRASMIGSIPGSSSHPFPNRNRRQLSIGGPPKAVLGGPARKLSPLPAVAVASVVPPQKVKKVNVKLPKETIPTEEEGQLSTREQWARQMLDGFEFKEPQVVPVESTTKEAYPPDEWRHHIPNTLDVFLPGELAWEEMKQKEIEEKLEKLGVERGFGSNVPHIHAPHARAASISSPADPQILLYKLNKLQQSQEGIGSRNSSLTTSPHLPFGGLSSSPHTSSANRHGHTMSLAPPSSRSFLDSNDPAFNPFGPSIELEVDPIPHSGPSALQGGVHASHGRLAPNATSRPSSRPDFIRGFGLDIPEEDEEGAENVAEETDAEGLEGSKEQVIKYSPVQLASHLRKTEPNVDEAATVSQSCYHSRHASKLSAALSTQSVNALDVDHFIEEDDLGVRDEIETDDQDNNLDEDVAGEWTGSEDVYTGEPSEDEESIGEWSNPSDEEKARIERHERRNSRRASAQIDLPRRIPNFPRPPDNTIAIAVPRDEDIVSNPSEEETSHNMARSEYLRRLDYYSRPPSNLSGPAKQLPHSRGPSAQHTAYDPALAHSRSSSNQNAVSGAQAQTQPTQLTLRHDTLNPFATPFVFGGRGDSGSWGQISTTDVVPPNPSLSTHVRLPSLGKPLNVAAPEFKPGQFTFRPPAGVPIMPHPLPETLQHEASESPFRVQGREKRQRRGSSSSVEEGDSMVSFKFPHLESPSSIPHSPVVLTHKLNPSAEPFTFAGFSAAIATLPRVPRANDALDETGSKVVLETVEVLEADPEETYNEESTIKEEAKEEISDLSQNEELKLPATTTKPKRAPIPLDFKHPVSNNTVPAGLFKALNSNSGDERRRNTVRSRLSSREIFEHSRRPSMDDSNVAQIANKGGRPRYITDPGHRESSPPDDSVGKSHSRRRSSFTDAIRLFGRRSDADSEADAVDEAKSEISLTGQLDTRPIETLIQEGFANLKNDIKQHGKTQREILFDMQVLKTRYAEVAKFEVDQLDTRGELDPQVITDIVERLNNKLVQVLREDLHDIRQQIWQAQAGGESSEVGPTVEQPGNRMISAVIEAISEASSRQEAIIRSAPAQERDLVIDNLMTVLTPLMSSLRAEPVDYEFLTSELTQAVKPHISQLIDLASDKQETAGLIIDRLIPMLPTSDIDVDVITQKLTAEVRRAIAPIDAFEIKEQVADLVVERLDSRLAVRDKAFNIDSLSSRVTECVLNSLEPLQAVLASLEQNPILQTLESRQKQTSSDLNLDSELSTKLNDELQSLKITQTEILTRLELLQTGAGLDLNVLAVKAVVEEILTSQQIIASQAKDLHSFHQLILEKLDVLPDSIHAATDALQNNHIDFLNSHESTKRELDELRKSNADYQIQLSKARGAHGQIRVEKDVLSEKLASVESERDRIRSQNQALQASSIEKTAQMDALVAKNIGLEEALAAALTRLQASDVATQADHKRIEELEEGSRELLAQKQSLRTKVDSLELQVASVNCDKESAVQVTEALQQQHDLILAQQSNWDELRRASEKIDTLASLIGKENNEELKELRRYRDRTQTLEHDHAALQKRLKELETKVGNSERTVTTVKQSLTQAQQRSSEWERQAKELEAQLEITCTKLEQTEQAHAQLDADHSLVKLQFEEREANDRLTQGQLNKLREQIFLLENKSNRLQAELDHANTIKVPVPRPYRNITNGNSHPPPRPDSRASTIYIDRSATPQQNINSSVSTARSSTPVGSGTVSDSMHAPKTDAHKYANPPWAPSPVASRNRYPNFGHKYRPIAPPSPTPSTVSLVPTQDKDGWWS